MDKEKIKLKSFVKIISIAVIVLLVLAVLIIVATILNKERIKELSLNPRDTNINNSVVDSAEEESEKILELKEMEGIDKDDHSTSDIQTPVQMVLYSDFACEFCAEFKDNIEMVLDENKENLALVYRHFPSLTDPRSMEAALASECASEQDMFWKMYGKLYEDNKENKLEYEEYLRDAEELELDLAKFSECFKKQMYKDKIMEQYMEGRNYYVTGTPTFFLNKDIYVGAYPLDDFVRSDGEKVKGLRNLIKEYLEE